MFQDIYYMSVLPAVQHFLKKKGIGFRFVSNHDVHSASIVDGLVNAAFISDGSSVILAIYPAEHSIDFEMLRLRTRRNFNITFPSAEQLSLRGMPLENLFPAGGWYGVNAIIDKSLLQQPVLYLPAGDGNTLVQLDSVQAKLLYESSIPLIFSRAGAVVENVTDVYTDNESLDVVSESVLLARVSDIKTLPPAMHTASALLKLMSDPDLSARELGVFVEKDPLLTAVVIKHASAPFYGYRGQLTSVNDAIMHVLGVELTLNLVLGRVFSAQLNIPQDGPAGRRQLLSESIQTAYAMQALAGLSVFNAKISPKQAYLTGLMYKLGYFIAAHHFPQAYVAFNESLPDEVGPEREEKFKAVFSMTSLRLGAAFLNSMNILPSVAAQMLESREEYEAGTDPVQDMLLVAICHGKPGTQSEYQSVLANYGLNDTDLTQCIVGSVVEQQRKEHLVFTLSETF